MTDDQAYAEWLRASQFTDITEVVNQRFAAQEEMEAGE